MKTNLLERYVDFRDRSGLEHAHFVNRTALLNQNFKLKLVLFVYFLSVFLFILLYINLSEWIFFLL